MRRLSLILILFPLLAHSQIGGRQVFDFLRLPNSPRQTALGGHFIAVQNTDNALAMANPALLNKYMHHKPFFGWIDFLGGINYGNVGYARHYEKFGTAQIGLQYVNYGSFTEADAYGNRTGSFSAGDVALYMGVAREVAENLSVGANLKVVNSTLYQRSSWGLGMDLGVRYYFEKWDLHIGGVARNIGRQLNPYTQGSSTWSMPTDIQLGLTKRIPHTPMRLGITGQQLNRKKMVYEDPTAEVQLDLAGNPVEKKITTTDQVFRHMTFSLEFLLNKNLQLRAGYNHQRRRELRSPDDNGFNLNGFSFGAGIRLNRFYLDYGYANYHAVGGVHHFQISTFLSTFKKGWEYKPTDYEYDFN